MFSSPKMPASQPPPVSPVFEQAAQRQRAAEAAAAAGDMAAGGRRSTEFAGRTQALTAQIAKAQKRKSLAGEELLA